MSGWVAGAVVVSSVISGAAAKKAADTAARGQREAAQATTEAAQKASDVQERMFERQIELQEPWRQAGLNALAQIRGGFTGKVDLAQDPGYAFRLAEGQKALERSAAARGGLLSGATLRGTQRFGQELASQEYQNAYNRALTQYNTLANLAGVGQTTASGMASQAGQLGANLGNLYYGAGTAAGQQLASAEQARASGYLGIGNALTSAIGTGLNYYQGQQLLNRMYPAPGAGAGTFGGGYSPVPGGGVPSTPFFAR